MLSDYEAVQPPLIEVAPTPAPGTAQLIESLLFIAGEPITIAQLIKALELPADAVEAGIEALVAACANRGVRVQRHEDRLQLVSAPEAASVIERFLGVQSQQRLSAAALEVLAIIAYRQPLTRAQIEAIRGVDCGGVVRALLGRELIGEVGRLETIGRPILYGTTPEFLRQFGLGSLNELPDLPELPGLPEQQPASHAKNEVIP
jgi:segregation and condensation protein B